MNYYRGDNHIHGILALMAMGILLGLTCSDRVACGDITVKSAPDVVIYDGTYPGWPWIDATPSGKLLCVWREGIRHAYSANGKVMLSTSADGGKTWPTPATIQDVANIDDRNVAILAISDMNWLVCYDVYDGSTHRAMTTYTKDSGNSWSTPVSVNSTSNSSTRSAAVKLSSGKLLLPYYTTDGTPYYSNNCWTPMAAISTDNGDTWTNYTVPVTSECVGNEWSVIELDDGKLVGIMRSGARDTDNSLYITTSINGGTEWTTPEKTNLIDSVSRSPAQLLMIGDKLWAVYDDARYKSVALATTNDPTFVNWNVDEQIQAYQYQADGSAIDDGGYPSFVHLGDGRVLIVDYFINGDTRQIVGYYATVPMPEPGTLAMLAAATIGLFAYAWRKRR